MANPNEIPTYTIAKMLRALGPGSLIQFLPNGDGFLVAKEATITVKGKDSGVGESIMEAIEKLDEKT